MGRISVCYPGLAIVAIVVGVCHGYYIRDSDFQTTYGDQQQFLQQGTNSMPMLYGQGLSASPYSQRAQRQLILQQQNPIQAQQVQQLQPLGFVARKGRSSKKGFSNREEEEEVAQGDYDEEEDDTLSFAASKRKKHPKGKKKKQETKLSFPRRVFKKTKNAISSTTKAVFGAPKYIYTRYRDSLGFGEKKEKKGKGHEKGWGWDDRRDDDDGWGWESSNRYEKYARPGSKSKSRPYRYNKYAYTQPEEMREMTPMTSLNAWLQ